MSAFPGRCTVSCLITLVRAYQSKGWAGIRNRELLQRAEPSFDLFITADQNLRYQQNLARRTLAVLELSTNDLRRIIAASALIEEAIEGMKPNEFKRLNIP